MMIEFTQADIDEARAKSLEPLGPVLDVKVDDLDICETCFHGADVHAHVLATWENGATRRQPISIGHDMQREWMLTHRRDLYRDWLAGEGWAHRQ
jgi:hypothetical protein